MYKLIWSDTRTIWSDRRTIWSDRISIIKRREKNTCMSEMKTKYSTVGTVLKIYSKKFRRRGKIDTVTSMYICLYIADVFRIVLSCFTASAVN
jgi:hypothetical protein